MANNSETTRSRAAAKQRPGASSTRERANRSNGASKRSAPAKKTSASSERQPHVRVPVLGVSLPVPPPDRAAFYAGLTVLTVIELIDWPVALVVGAGHALAARSRNRAVEGVAESAESA